MSVYRKTTLRMLAVCLPLAILAVTPSLGHGQFVETNYGGLLDTQTGLVWGKSMDMETGQTSVEAYIDIFYNTLDPFADPPLPLFLEFSGGFDDWRPPTISEVMTAIDHGLLDHIDFSYFQAGRQDANSVMDAYLGEPDGLTYAEADFWTACTQRWKGLHNRGHVTFGNGDDIPFDAWFQSGSAWLIAVRGMPEDHTNCPGKHGQEENKPDKPGKPPKK